MRFSFYYFEVTLHTFESNASASPKKCDQDQTTVFRYYGRDCTKLKAAIALLFQALAMQNFQEKVATCKELEYHHEIYGTSLNYRNKTPCFDL